MQESFNTKNKLVFSKYQEVRLGRKPLKELEDIIIKRDWNATRSDDRLKLIDWGKFTGKTVLDLGCNNGIFCFRAKMVGAKRVVGVDKRLMIIEPNEEGHIESSVINQEESVATLLKIQLNLVFERVHALVRRDEVGRGTPHSLGKSAPQA